VSRRGQPRGRRFERLRRHRASLRQRALSGKRAAEGGGRVHRAAVSIVVQASGPLSTWPTIWLAGWKSAAHWP